MNELVTATLLVLVREMREAQTKYFRTRDKEDLMQAKYTEKKVDSFLRSFDLKEAKDES